MEYKCHSSQLSKIHRDKTRHITMSLTKEDKNKRFDSYPKYMLIEQVQYIGHKLKESTQSKGIQPKVSYAAEFPSP